MKKVMWGIAAGALILASCSQNEILENKTEENVIGFTNLNDRTVTKAANDANSDYGVYAIRSNATGVWFMQNVQVDGDDNTYSPLHYWPVGTETVNFYAYAPYSGGATITDANTSALSVSYTVPVNADEDFTIATPVTGANATNGTVALEFSHMLSKITVTAVLDASLLSAGYSIDLTSASASLTVAKNQGSTDLITKAALTASGSSTTYAGAKSYMFIPQTSTETTLQLIGVTIKHNGEVYWTGDMKAYTIVAGNVTGDAFAPNTHYAVTFTINSSADDSSDQPVFGSAIAFSSSIATWSDATISLTQPAI